MPKPSLPRYRQDVLRALICVVVVVILIGCQGTKSTGPSAVAQSSAPADPWKITCMDPTVKTPALLWNGLIGVRIGRDGTGFGPDGKPLPSFVIGGYEASGEEKILAQENPLQVRLLIDGEPALRVQAKDYRQVVDMSTGELSTGWKLRDGTEVSISTYISPNSRVFSQRWHVSSGSAGHLQVQSLYPGKWLLSGEEAVVQSNEGARARLRHSSSNGDWKPIENGQELSLDVQAGKSMTFDRTIALEPRAADGNGEITPTYDEVKMASESAWSKRWKTDIVIDGPVEDQQAVRSFLFYLRSAINPMADPNMSISPCGLSSSQYFGHVFWDADIWVFPALAFVDPDRAKRIPQYRLDRSTRAESNFRSWCSSGAQTATGKLGGPPSQVAPAVKFPWESSVSGKETTPTDSRFEDHITGSVAFSVDQARALGLVDPAKASNLIQGARTFFLLRSEPSQQSLREIKGVMSPDEYFKGNNDLYTNLLAQWTFNGCTWRPQRPAKDQMFLPQDDKSLLTYEGDPVKSYKQAAAVLAIYPLQYPPAEKEARTMMNRFADKVSKNGPAMTDSVHAIIWARTGETEKAYDAWKRSWKDFVREPHLLFSEKRSKDVTYFTTGAGGSLQSVIYGLLGFRLDSEKEPGAVWSKKLIGDHWLSIKPNLPKAWKSVTFKNFKVLGQTYTLTATHSGAQVSKGD